MPTIKFSRLIFILSIVVASTNFAYALDFVSSYPNTNTVIKEGDLIRIMWSGELKQQVYGSNSPSPYLMLALTSSSNSNTPVNIGVADVTATSFLWQVPQGVTNYFKGESKYKVRFTRGDQVAKSATFVILNIASTTNKSVATTSDSTDYNITYTPFLSVGADGVFDPLGTKGTTAAINYGFGVNINPVATSEVSPNDQMVQSTGACDVISHDLYIGVSGRDTEVTALQEFLIKNKFLDASASGYFGSKTDKAVKAFQKANDISQSGYVGTITRSKIKSICE